MRIFLGVETANAEMELASAANYLAMITNGRAVKKNNLHVTVKYFGSVQSVNSISRIEETAGRLRRQDPREGYGLCASLR